MHLIHCPKDTACGPANNFVHVYIKYGIHMHLSNALESGSYCSIAQWKKLANYVISNYFQWQVSVTLPLFPSLGFLGQSSVYHHGGL